MRWSGHLVRCGAVWLTLGQLAVPGTDADLGRRYAELRDAVTAEGTAAILRCAASRRLPQADLASAANRIELGPEELLHVLSPEGGLLFSTDPDLLQDHAFVLPSGRSSARRALFERARREASGTGSYAAFDAATTRPVRRDAMWSSMGPSAQGGIMLLEREQPVDRTPEAPLTGKWIGAYTHAAHAVDSGGKPEAGQKSAGQVSVLMVQNGARLLVRFVAPSWQVTVRGLIVGDRFTAGNGLFRQADESPEIWFAEGAYAPEEDRIKGTLYTSLPSRAETRTFYLHPVVPLDPE